MISIENVEIPKYEEPILAEYRKKIVTVRTDKKVKNHDNPSKIIRRFQIGDLMAGYFENQYIGM